MMISSLYYFCFFFQAEDGIRDTSVTGVQTCALPISRKKIPHLVSEQICRPAIARMLSGTRKAVSARTCGRSTAARGIVRSEERRVGKEWRYRWAAALSGKKKKREEMGRIRSDKRRER